MQANEVNSLRGSGPLNPLLACALIPGIGSGGLLAGHLAISPSACFVLGCRIVSEEVSISEVIGVF